MARKNVDIYVKAHDQASAGFKRMGGALEGLDRGIRSFRNMALGGIGIYGIGRAFMAAGREAVQFESQIAEVSTMLRGAGMAQLEGYRRGIADLAREFGEGTETLAKGAYDILSAGVSAEKGMMVLRAASKAAKAGVTDTATMAKILTGLLNAFELEADQVGRVSDLVFKIVQRGVTTAPEVAANLGNVATMVKQTGMSMEEMGAAVAMMTRKFIAAPKAVTALKGALGVFLKPSEQGAEHAARFGLKLDQATIGSEGLIGVLERLKAAGATMEDLAKIFPEKETLIGIAALYGGIGEYAGEIAEFNQTIGAMEEAFAKMTATASTEIAKLGQEWAAFKRSLGEDLAPVGLGAVEYLQRMRRDLAGEEDPAIDRARQDRQDALQEALAAETRALAARKVAKTDRERVAAAQALLAARQELIRLEVAEWGREIPTAGLGKTPRQMMLGEMTDAEARVKNAEIIIAKRIEGQKALIAEIEQTKKLAEAERERAAEAAKAAAATARAAEAMDPGRMADEEAYGRQLAEEADNLAEIERIERERMRTEYAEGLRMKFAEEDRADALAAAAAKAGGYADTGRLAAAFESSRMERAPGQNPLVVAAAKAEHQRQEQIALAGQLLDALRRFTGAAGELLIYGGRT